MKHGKPKPEATAKGKEDMLKALAAPNVFGLIYRAIKIAKISLVTHYNWFDNDPVYAAKVRELRNARKEFAEHKLYELVKMGDQSCVQFVNRCLRRDEYTPDTKLVGDTDQPITIKMPDGLIEEAMKKIYLESSNVKPITHPPK